MPNKIRISTHDVEIGPPTASIGVNTSKSPRSHHHTMEKERGEKEHALTLVTPIDLT
jgi:hypothetical protein